MDNATTLFQEGDNIKFTNKLSGSEYNGTIEKVYDDCLLIWDGYQNYKVYFKIWDVIKITGED